MKPIKNFKSFSMTELSKKKQQVHSDIQCSKYSPISPAHLIINVKMKNVYNYVIYKKRLALKLIERRVLTIREPVSSG